MPYSKVGPFTDNTGPAYDTAAWLNGVEDGIVEAQQRISINTQAGAYTLVLADAGKMVRCTSATAVAVTIPANSTVAFTTGTIIEVRQAGTGQISIAAAGGVTINSEASMLKVAAQHRGVTLIKVATDTWDLDGALTA